MPGGGAGGLSTVPSGRRGVLKRQNQAVLDVNDCLTTCDCGCRTRPAPLDALARTLELTAFELQLANGGALKGEVT